AGSAGARAARAAVPRVRPARGAAAPARGTGGMLRRRPRAVRLGYGPPHDHRGRAHAPCHRRAQRRGPRAVHAAAAPQRAARRVRRQDGLPAERGRRALVRARRAAARPRSRAGVHAGCRRLEPAARGAPPRPCARRARSRPRAGPAPLVARRGHRGRAAARRQRHAPQDPRGLGRRAAGGEHHRRCGRPRCRARPPPAPRRRRARLRPRRPPPPRRPRPARPPRARRPHARRRTLRLAEHRTGGRGSARGGPIAPGTHGLDRKPIPRPCPRPRPGPQHPMKPAVSLIATVRNEADSIEHFLRSILAQTRAPDEVVIVDGGSRDDTVARILALRARVTAPRIHVLRAPGANISQGRNIAIARATGPIIAVTDAGTALAPDWLEHIVRPLEADAQVAVSAGFFEPAGATRFERCLAVLITPQLPEIEPERFLPSSRSVAFRKEWWLRVGGYPEWLRHCEDLV